MQSDLFLFVGSGIFMSALLLGLVLGGVTCAKPQHAGFRYGAFIIRFATVFGPGYCIAASVLAFGFLGIELGAYISIVMGVALLGLVFAAFRVEFRSKTMLFVQSIPFVLFYFFLPLVLWNVIYAFAVMKKNEWKTEPNQALQTTPMARSAI